MSDSLQHHGLQPTRLLCPWDSPGKNTGVGSNSLLQKIFPTQGLNPSLLHYRQLLFLPSGLPGKPCKWVQREQISKVIYNKPIANIILNGEMLNSFLLNSGTRQGCLLSPFVFSVALEALATAVRQEKVIKDTQIRREDVKLSLFVDDMILYMLLLLLLSRFSRVQLCATP